jgi:hypothetical protein
MLFTNAVIYRGFCVLIIEVKNLPLQSQNIAPAIPDKSISICLDAHP